MIRRLLACWRPASAPPTPGPVRWRIGALELDAAVVVVAGSEEDAVRVGVAELYRRVGVRPYPGAHAHYMVGAWRLDLPDRPVSTWSVVVTDEGAIHPTWPAWSWPEDIVLKDLPHA